MSAASRAKRSMPEMEVLVLEKTQDVSYSACGMPYNIADAGRQMEDLVVRSADVFRQKQDINLLTGHRVERIDTVNRTVTGTIQNTQKPFSFAYDRLLIATGGRPVIPDLPGVDLPGVQALKSLADGKAIKDYLQTHAVKKVVIIGMGYIGLEMAEALRARDIAVEMVKPGPDLLPWMPRDLAGVVEQELEANAVGLYPGHTITAIENAENRLNVVCPEKILTAGYGPGGHRDSSQQ